MLSLLPVIIRFVWQVTKFNKIFETGCLRPTHGKTTTLLADRGTAEQGHGLSEAPRSQNGRHLDRVLFSGSLENVSHHLGITLSQRLIVLPGLQQARGRVYSGALTLSTLTF